VGQAAGASVRLAEFGRILPHTIAVGPRMRSVGNTRSKLRPGHIDANLVFNLSDGEQDDDDADGQGHGDEGFGQSLWLLPLRCLHQQCGLIPMGAPLASGP
jgi:hypothetical protein